MRFTLLFPIMSLICISQVASCFAVSPTTLIVLPNSVIAVLFANLPLSFCLCCCLLQAAAAIARSILDHSVFLQYVESDPFDENAIPGKNFANLANFFNCS